MTICMEPRFDLTHSIWHKSYICQLLQHTVWKYKSASLWENLMYLQFQMTIILIFFPLTHIKPSFSPPNITHFHQLFPIFNSSPTAHLHHGYVLFFITLPKMHYRFILLISWDNKPLQHVHCMMKWIGPHGIFMVNEKVRVNVLGSIPIPVNQCIQPPWISDQVNSIDYCCINNRSGNWWEVWKREKKSLVLLSTNFCIFINYVA